MSETRKKPRRLEPPARRPGPLIPACLLLLVIAVAVILGVALRSADLPTKKAAFTPIPAEDGSLVINEVMASNRATLHLEDGTLPDWVEIKNIGAERVYLGGCVLASGINYEDLYAFPAMSLEAGECLVLYADNRPGKLHLPYCISSGGETLTLMDASGKVLDSVTTPALDSDEAWARGEDLAWYKTAFGTPGADNEIISADDALLLDRDLAYAEQASVRINEVVSKNVSISLGDGAYDYIELINTSDRTVSLSGWHLSDDRLKLAKYAFPDIALASGEKLIVRCSGQAALQTDEYLHAGFRLSSGGEKLYLTDASGDLVDFVEVTALFSDQAYSYDGSAYTASLAPTPGRDNTLQNAWSTSETWRQISGTQVYITEISASATETQPDWIELYNASGDAVSLDSWGLSDNPKNPFKWRFPSDARIGPGQYYAVFCTGEDGMYNGYPTVSFKLSSLGGYFLRLTDANGQCRDGVFVPEQYEGVTYGRADGQTGFYYFENGTPLSSNTQTAYLGRLSAPEYSVSGGLFESGDALTVSISAPEGARVYYTLDSTDPDESDQLYTGPISINSTTILRTRVYQNNYLPSYANTQSYLYDIHTEPNVYIVSLVSDPDNLVSDDRGIMVKGTGDRPNYRQNWERPASFELFTSDGELAVNANCGISLHGGGSRDLKIKSFNVIARGMYGDKRFNYPIFSERDWTSYKSVLLRPSGEDFSMSFMRDTLLTSLMEGSSLLYQKWELSVVYIDGEYYALDYIRERLTADTVCMFEGWEGMEDDIDLIKEEAIAVRGSNDTFKALLTWCKQNDTTTPEAMEYLESQIDVQNYIEYMTAEIFTGNTDLLNVRRYRNARADGKWRWMLYDLDWAFFNDTNSMKSWLDSRGAGVGNAADTTLFRACMSNPDFRDRYLTYFGEMLATRFSTEYVLERIQERYDLISPFIAEYEARWDLSLEAGIRKLVQYAQDRPQKIIDYITETLSLTDADVNKYFGAALEKIQARQ